MNTPCPHCHGTRYRYRYTRLRDGNCVRAPIPCVCQCGAWRLSRHVVASPGMCGGRPYVEGHRIALESVGSLVAAGYQPRDLQEHWPQVPLEKLEDAAAVWVRMPAEWWTRAFDPREWPEELR